MNSPNDPSPVGTFTLRRCLLLSLPALIVGFLLRAAFVHSIPEVFYGSDSNSYFETALRFWQKHEFFFPEKRRGLYPLFVMLSPLLPGSPARDTALLQHLFGLLVIPAAGWVTGHVARRPALWVPVVTCLVALSPAALWYEHEMMADSPLAVVFAVTLAMAFPLEGLRGRRLVWFLIGTLAIVAMKPHGRPFWLGLVMAAALIRWPAWRWGWPSFAVLAASVAVILGTGSSKQGSWLLLSSTLPLVDIEGESYPEYRRLLAPVIRETYARLDEYAFLQMQYKKALSTKDPESLLGPEWPALVKKRERYSKATKALSREAIRHHPLEWLRLTSEKMGIAAAFLPTQTSFAFHPAEFWAAQAERNDDRWRKNASEPEMVYERDEPAYRAMVAERLTRPALVPAWIMRLGGKLTWTRVQYAKHVPPRVRFTWVAALGALGICSLLTLRRWPFAAVLLLPLGGYLLAIYGIGDAVPRYMLPVEWLGFLLACLGADWLLDLALRLLPARIHPKVVEQKLQPAHPDLHGGDDPILHHL